MNFSELAVVIEKTDDSHLDFLHQEMANSEITNRLVISGRDLLTKPASFDKVAVNPNTMEIIPLTGAQFELKYRRGGGKRVEVLYGQTSMLIGSLLAAEIPTDGFLGGYLFTLRPESEIGAFLRNRTLDDVKHAVSRLILDNRQQVLENKRLNYNIVYPRAVFGQKS